MSAMGCTKLPQIIDFHTHIFPDVIAEKSIASLEEKAGIKAATDGTLQGLLESMDRSGVDLSVILPVVTKPSQFDRINSFAAEVNAKYGDRVLSFGGIDIGLPETVHCPPDRMRKVLDAVKPKKMVLAHTGGWKQWDAVYEYLAGEDVYLDTSFTFDYISREQFLKILDKHAPDKVLFATDSPWSCAAKGIQAIRTLPVSEEVKKAILWENAARLLEL